jgi:hypothetical protein
MNKQFQMNIDQLTQFKEFENVPPKVGDEFESSIANAFYDVLGAARFKIISINPDAVMGVCVEVVKEQK